MFELFVLLNSSKLNDISRMKKEAINLMRSGDLKAYFKKILEVEKLEQQTRAYQYN